MCSRHFKILAASICSVALFPLANADITAPDLSNRQEGNTTQGIDGTGLHGIDGTGILGIDGTGFRTLGIDGTGLQGIDATGIQGIDGTGIEGIDGTGILTANRRGLLGIDGTGLQGIDGTGIHGIDGTGIRAKSIVSVTASGLKTKLGNISTAGTLDNTLIQRRTTPTVNFETIKSTTPDAALPSPTPFERTIGFDQVKNAPSKLLRGAPRAAIR